LLIIPFLFNSYIKIITGGFIRRILNYYKRQIFDNFIALNIKVLNNLISYIFKTFNKVILQIIINFKGGGLNLVKKEKYKNYNIYK